MPKLSSLNKPESLSKMAYDALRASILSGQLKIDEVYNEMALAKDLGISRTPVREALLELSTKGLVTFLPRKGVMVNRFSEQDVAEIFELRKAIESIAVEKAAGASPPCDMHGINKILKDQRQAIEHKDYGAFLQADRAFHTKFSELTGNQRLIAIMENLRDMIHLMGTQALGLEGRAEKVVSEHEKIVEAIRQGKPAAARKALIHHLNQSEEAVNRTKL